MVYLYKFYLAGKFLIVTSSMGNRVQNESVISFIISPFYQNVVIHLENVDTQSSSKNWSGFKTVINFINLPFDEKE